MLIYGVVFALIFYAFLHFDGKCKILQAKKREHEERIKKEIKSNQEYYNKWGNLPKNDYYNVNRYVIRKKG